MVHADYKEMIPARALSALDAAEAQALNKHLENCAECRQELEEWQATAANLSLTADQQEPSPAVRDRILSEVRKELEPPHVIPFRSTPRSIWNSFGSLGAMAAVVLVTALIVGLVVLWRQTREMENRLAESRKFVELVTTPGARVAELAGVDRAAGASATVAYDQSGRVMLVASNLPSLPQGKAYQLWFFDAKSSPLPGSTFVPDNEGKGTLNDKYPGALPTNIFAITVEPTGGVPKPTGPIYLRTPTVN